mmetsp:Transcript_4608/g.8475  ORF Transcript_4608/g.8475 Transcript_4608/m.8475 type:complete len:432 (-) Transcript_4608:153-1448(-)
MAGNRLPMCLYPSCCENQRVMCPRYHRSEMRVVTCRLRPLGWTRTETRVQKALAASPVIQKAKVPTLVVVVPTRKGESREIDTIRLTVSAMIISRVVRGTSMIGRAQGLMAVAIIVILSIMTGIVRIRNEESGITIKEMRGLSIEATERMKGILVDAKSIMQTIGDCKANGSPTTRVAGLVGLVVNTILAMSSHHIGTIDMLARPRMLDPVTAGRDRLTIILLEFAQNMTRGHPIAKIEAWALNTFPREIIVVMKLEIIVEAGKETQIIRASDMMTVLEVLELQLVRVVLVVIVVMVAGPIMSTIVKADLKTKSFMENQATRMILNPSTNALLMNLVIQRWRKTSRTTQAVYPVRIVRGKGIRHTVEERAETIILVVNMMVVEDTSQDLRVQVEEDDHLMDPRSLEIESPIMIATRSREKARKTANPRPAR